MASRGIAGTLYLTVFAFCFISTHVRGQACRYFELSEVLPWLAGVDDHLGVSVALDGDWLVAGAPGHNVLTFNDGAAYVYKHMDGFPGRWRQTAQLVAWDEIGGALGFSVSVDGDRIVVGAPADGCGHYCDSGAAYVFRYNGSDWVPEQKLLASDVAENLRFGDKVRISGDWIAVGSVFRGFTEPATGGAYMFRLDHNGTPGDDSDDFWVEHVKLTTPAGADDDRFGTSLDLGGGRLVVGATGFFDAGNEERTDPGLAHVFRHEDNGTPADLSDDSWVFEATLVADDAEPDDWRYFGFKVAISSDLALIAALRDDEGALAARGESR